MEKKWRKEAEGSYVFQVDGVEVGKMNIIRNSLNQKATAQMDGKTYNLKRVGFWKTIIEITDQNDMPVAKVFSEKWFSNTTILEYKGVNYRLQLRSKSLGEYALKRDGQDLLIYGLYLEKRKLEVRIFDSGSESDYFFDALLWYLFAPIATENMSDNLITAI